MTVRAPSPSARADLLRLGHNERTVPLPAEAVGAALATVDPMVLTMVPDLTSLTGRLAEFVHGDPDRILVTPGADAAAAWTFAALVGPGDEVVMPDPSYHRYAEMSDLVGAVPRRIAPVAGGRGAGDFAAAIGPRTRLVVVVNPDSPTGDVLDASQLADVLYAAREVGATVVVDEVYHGFGAPTAIGVPGLDDLVVLRSFSKAWGLAGIRVGFLVAPPDVVAAVARHRTRHPVSALSAHVIEHFLDRPDIVDDYVAEMHAAVPLLVDGLANLGCRVHPTGASWVIVDLPPTVDRDDVTASLRACGVEVSAGLPSPWERSIRLTVGTRPQVEALLPLWAEVVAEPAAGPVPGVGW